jgi:CheY-like chemotaxis protein
VKTILIVEDVALNRDLLVQLLEGDYRIVLAEDGQAALQKAVEAKPDLILMDLSLPRMDGWEATRRLRGDEERARASGCDDFLTKPVDEALLFQKLERHLGR